MEPRTSSRSFAPIYYAVGLLFAISVLVFLAKLYLARSKTLRLQRQGLAMPPVHPIFGHLLVIYRILSKLPQDAHPHYLPDQIRRAMPELGPIFYIDAWPFLTLTLVVASPSSLHQITQEHSLPKFPAIRSFLYPLTNGLDIVSMDGQQWKTWRNVFNPGFSANHLMTLVPDIVRESAVFCKVLQSHAQKQDVFAMKGLTDNLAMDVIGRVVLDTNLNSQQSQNKMVHALRRQMRWLAFGDEGNLQRFHPLRPFVHAYNAYQMDSYLSPELDSRFAVHQESEKTKDMKRSKSVIDLALTAYLSGKAGGGNPTQGTMDSAFKTLAMNQIKLFLFSGHDTTSSSICYIFYLLSTNPTTLSHVRAEHDQLFGSTPSEAASLIASDPYLLNQLPYTTAVIKESMRLFPAASTTRSGEPGFSITDFKNGNQYPTDDCLVWLIPQAIQRDPAYWPHPDRFLPERWLTSPGDLLHPVKGAWRPFENGPRACIGQELAMLEMKIVMVLTCREFDISAAYGEVDGERKGKGKGTQGVRTVDGERAYQIEHGQPSGNLPCRVKRAV